MLLNIKAWVFPDLFTEWPFSDVYYFLLLRKKPNRFDKDYWLYLKLKMEQKYRSGAEIARLLLPASFPRVPLFITTVSKSYYDNGKDSMQVRVKEIQMLRC